MSETSVSQDPVPSGGRQAGAHGASSSKAALAVGAIGVVFGDIGTSPIYAFRETFVGPHPLALDTLHLLGVLSLIFWSMTIIVSIQYVTIMMRADNKGQGGTLALVALISGRVGRTGYGWVAVMLGVFATALFYGDSMITPAISVLSAVEGLTTVEDSFEPFVVPIALVLLIGLFLLQRRGTAKVGRLFAPVMLVYFSVLAILGLIQIVQNPGVLAALNPWYAVQFFLTDKLLAFLALGSVVLAVTGAEALYADMGHFGRGALRIGWFGFVMPCLLLNYFGQAAMIMGLEAAAAADAIRNPFFLMAPDAYRLPLVLLATCATFIASQAVITGAFSVTHQAIQLGYVPRLSILHTSETEHGQIYIPFVNWVLMIAVILLVLTFRNSSNLASAYGIAVTGAMLIDTCLMAVLFIAVWRWKMWIVIPAAALFFVFDGAFFGANLTKVPDGGWFPLLVGAIAFTFLTTWSRGRKLMRERMSEVALPIEIFAKSAKNSAIRVPGTAIFMASSTAGVPSALLHNIKHNRVLHERVVILTVEIAEEPYVDPERRIEFHDLGDGFYRMVLHYGFMEETDVPAALKQVNGCGGAFDMMNTSFFLSRQTLLPSKNPSMMIWREKIFSWMLRNAATAMEFFRLPTNRVVELGSQVEI
ncbi:potassium transporter Kup [Pelagerythrobacter marinus]|uniref:Probable potassium transport system protein Kup n=1 Tax=Pelagerythrobacter marinus TaxID=538382 RepID=A0ABW9UVV9_9SPHN|nr:potassium transporter Kup [Pelagerythrobacter marinus]MEC9066234.1 potassium transporter Kup [Pseudomonadota bacterium]MXO68091.1 potassium transporter Kup [Pelagerythrobacter marinus]USA40748.1 potassium transporter Kup [Pelagerythrobacter marinus]WPZ08079.1 potassium transporter Kup [Pelagerythrobacter marinus]